MCWLQSGCQRVLNENHTTSLKTEVCILGVFFVRLLLGNSTPWLLVLKRCFGIISANAFSNHGLPNHNFHGLFIASCIRHDFYKIRGCDQFLSLLFDFHPWLPIDCLFLRFSHDRSSFETITNTITNTLSRQLPCQRR